MDVIRPCPCAAHHNHRDHHHHHHHHHPAGTAELIVQVNGKVIMETVGGPSAHVTEHCDSKNGELTTRTVSQHVPAGKLEQSSNSKSIHHVLCSQEVITFVVVVVVVVVWRR